MNKHLQGSFLLKEFKQTGYLTSIVKQTRCTNVPNLFWNDTLRVSDGLSVHHQEFKTVHTAIDICQTKSNIFPSQSVWYVSLTSGNVQSNTTCLTNIFIDLGLHVSIHYGTKNKEQRTLTVTLK